MSNRRFKPVDWCHSTNIYEVNLRQYTPEGSFRAFARELPRLRDMGIEILWFMPITPIATEKRKGSLGSYYACSDFTSTNPEYGTLEDFKSLVSEAQILGFKVIIDWVANHTGWGHSWTISNPGYFKKNDFGEFFDSHGWDDVIDLDFDNKEMRKALIEAMRFWIKECGIDGFRCDMAMLVPLDFWIEARTALDEEKKLFWLAECEEANYHQAFDVTYTWEWMHKTVEFVKHHQDIHNLDHLLWKYNHDFPTGAMRMFFTSNHDENSWNGTEFEKYGEAHKTLAVFSATWNGIPLIYSGQELPNRKRLKFFDKDTIEWNGHCLYHDFYKVLLTLRKNHPALRAGDDSVSTLRLRTNADQHIFGFLRKCGEDEVLVLLNLSPYDGVGFTISDDIVHGAYQDAFSGQVHHFYDRHYMLNAWDFRVFVKQTA